MYVVADVPRVSYRTAGCVKSVRKRHAPLPPGRAPFPATKRCRPIRSQARSPGPQPRVHLIDLTSHFCDSANCFPVLGGAYVYRDTNHMNLTFAPTLGPYLLEGMGITARGSPSQVFCW